MANYTLKVGCAHNENFILLCESGGATIAATINIGGVTYPNIAMIEDQFDLTESLQERGRFQCDVIDYTGNHFVKGQQVTVTDPVLGIVFNGFINTDKEVPEYPTGYILHSIDCIGMHYLADKRTYTTTYSTSTTAGKIAVDMLSNVLSQENIYQNYAENEDTTQTDWNTGILSGTVGALNVGDGDLELAQAGSNVTIVESTTANFSTGTLSNVTATNNTLIPTTVSGLEVSVLLPTPQSTAYCEVTFWTGSQALGTNDTLNYDIWISSTSPQIMGTVDLWFSDNTESGGLVDQNGVTNGAGTDLSNYAKDQWYTRQCSTTAFNGKTAVKAIIRFAGTSQGTYTLYVKNVYIGSHSGTPLLATNATTTVTNPVQVNEYLWYVPGSIVGAVLPVMTPANTSRISPTYTISTVTLLSSSSVVWNAATPSGTAFDLSVSYDGGSSYTTCTNNAALPALPAGANISSASLVLKETFSVGTNPSAIPVLQNVTIGLISASNATKSDIITNYITQAQWNTGTYTYLTASSGGDLSMGSLARDWNDNLITNQTFFTPSGNVTQAATGGAYTIKSTVLGSTSDGFGNSRLDFCGNQILNFTLDIDMKFSNTVGDVGVTFRDSSSSWQAATNNTFAYAVTFASNTMTLYAGSNGSTDAIVTLTTASHTMSANTFYHLKVVVSGLNFQCYWNNEVTPSINFTDTVYNYQQPGGIGLRLFNHLSGTQTVTWDNLSFSPSPYGSWLSSAISLSSLATSGLSSIFWTQVNAANMAVSYVTVQTSVDGGSTYQTCTNNGAIPNLPAGTNLSGKTLIVNIFMSAIDTSIKLPIVRQLVWRVLGAYPGSSGTRSTVPLGNDTSITRTVGSGWGTAFDGQTWVQVGTGTTAVATGEETITNTTGDVHMVIGSRTWTDEDGTMRFQLSANTISAGIELRYVDANNYYRLSASQNSLSVIQRVGGVNTTLATVTPTIATSTWYRMRFRIAELSTGTLFARVWADGTLEPSTWNIAM